ncbi:IS1182-like element IS660 family transposase [Halalkalibacterium halodurans]|uniref:Transposase n=1 Tax=Halalkalibacterium halodurans TaxID=86665 RepID=A0A0M0KLM3_ALKHA|nr:IS1182-like element IS660 family transposase [Halalkalibacterium halodurans]TPE70799.1 IS1182-like element IS660 family transposase [Halalkalibacterium halodurans]
MRNQTATYQQYTMNQLVLPMDFSDLIPENHVARVVNDMVESLDDQLFDEVYKGGGRPAYHPKMMTKILLYGYTQKWFSCRAIAKALTEHLPMMWLAARQTPDFRTINRFRSERLKPLMDTLFSALTHLLIKEGYVDGSSYFLDGTKIEANANKYTFVWKKSVQKYEEKLQLKIDEMLQEIEKQVELDRIQIQQETNAEEKRISSEVLQAVARSVEQELIKRDEQIKETADQKEKQAQKQALKPLRKIYRTLTTDTLPRLRKYETSFRLLGERNSYSKTDPDATFMRMKDDHMKNGQLKAGYNWQIGTQDQFILFYTVHPNPTDTRCLLPHVEALKESGLPLPKTLIADAGYGSESNYVAMADELFETLIPSHTFRQEQKRSFAKKRFHPYNWRYDETDDVYWCPNQRKVSFKRYTKRTDPYGYARDFKVYECESCEGCPFKPECTKARGNRQVHYNPVYEELKAKQHQKLKSEEGRTLYQKRKTDVESVFGHVKQNLGFRRLHLRGKESVHIELGLVALAHNLRKRATVDRRSKELKNTNQHKNRENRIKRFSRFYVLRCFWDSSFLL